MGVRRTHIRSKFSCKYRSYIPRTVCKFFISNTTLTCRSAAGQHEVVNMRNVEKVGAARTFVRGRGAAEGEMRKSVYFTFDSLLFGFCPGFGLSRFCRFDLALGGGGGWGTDGVEGAEGVGGVAH
jgi:hypothetical protein